MNSFVLLFFFFLARKTVHTLLRSLDEFFSHLKDGRVFILLTKCKLNTKRKHILIKSSILQINVSHNDCYQLYYECCL